MSGHDEPTGSLPAHDDASPQGSAVQYQQVTATLPTAGEPKQPEGGEQAPTLQRDGASSHLTPAQPVAGADGLLGLVAAEAAAAWKPWYRRLSVRVAASVAVVAASFGLGWGTHALVGSDGEPEQGSFAGPGGQGGPGGGGQGGPGGMGGQGPGASGQQGQDGSGQAGRTTPDSGSQGSDSQDSGDEGGSSGGSGVLQDEGSGSTSDSAAGTGIVGTGQDVV